MPPDPVGDARDVLEEVERAIASLEQHRDAEVRDATRVLLEGIDAVHRAGLTHLVQAVRAMAGDPFLNRLITDPAIRLLLMSYSLIAVDRRLQAEEALDTVRGHLHGHGIDVEITEVVGGVVYVRVHASSRRDRVGAGLPLDAVRQDLEETLRAGFVGFQELVIRDRAASVASTQFVAIEGLRRNRPVYRDVLPLAELPPGRHQAVLVGEVPVLLINVDGDVYAIRNRCGESPLPLEFGTLNGAELRCPWHDCRYDVRSGRRVDGGMDHVHVFPVQVEEGWIRLALGVAPAGKL